ncbi:MAG: FixH family protein [Dehalococcoidia bacterium]
MKRRLIALVAAVSVLLVFASGARAHAYLERSDPTEGSYRATAPSEVRLWFTEGLEPGFTRGRVVDKDNAVVSSGPSTVSSVDPKLLVIPLGSLPNGVYTVVWENVSVEDGHPARGAFAFAIGDPASSTAPLTLASGAFGAGGGGFDPLGFAARWLNLLSGTALLGGLGFMGLIVGPLLRGDTLVRAAEWRSRRRYHRLLAIAALGLLVGWPLILLAQVRNVSGAGFPAVFDPGLIGAFLGTRYGQVLLVRLGLIVLVLGTVALLVRQERQGGRALVPTIATALLAAGVLATTSVVSHGAAVGEWAWIAILADWLHQLATAFWVGGVIIFALAVGPFFNAVAPGDRRTVLSRVIPRFSVLALTSVAVLSLTGLYAAWLHFPTLESIPGTTYGQALIVKSGLFVGALAIGALNLAVVTPGLRDAPAKALAVAMRFVRQIRIEAVVGVLIVGGAALMVMTPPATVAAGRSFEQTLAAGDLQVNLRLTPNEVGPNRYFVRVNGPDGRPAALQQLVLRFQMLDHEMGQQEVKLTPTNDGVWTAEGSNLSMVGNWGVRAMIRRQSGEEQEARFSVRVGGGPQQVRIPFPTPESFGLRNEALIPLAMIVLGGILAAWLVGTGRWRGLGRIAFVGGTALALMGAFVLVFQPPRLETANLPVNPIPRTQDSIRRGEAFYQETCAGCHGPKGKGDGPLARGLSRKPADLTQHVDYHPDGQFYLWVANGIPGTPMLAWGNQYTPEEIWDLVNYLKATYASAPS